MGRLLVEMAVSEKDSVPSNKTIDYAERYQQAVVGMLRGILEDVAEDGLPGAHHFYITFETGSPGVQLSPSLAEHYPDAMTIVLQNQFWGLAVDDEGFSVTLKFGGSPEPLLIPWTAVVAFADPSAEFGLQFQPKKTEPSEEALEEEQVDREADAKSDDDVADADHPSGVLDFEKFKKR